MEFNEFPKLFVGHLFVHPAYSGIIPVQRNARSGLLEKEKAGF